VNTQQQLPLNFNTFGDVGVVFSHAYSNLFAQSCAAWAQHSAKPWNEVLAEHMNPSYLWFSSVYSLHQSFGLPVADVFEVWKRLRLAFTEPLLAKDEIPKGVDERSQMLSLFAHDQQHAFKRFANHALNCVSYGPFDEEQLEFLSQNCARGVELGCGSGYLVDVLRKRGLDVIGIDSNAYKAIDGDGSDKSPGIMDMCPWSDRLRGENCLIQGDETTLADYATDRNLIISWPMPGSSFPFHALKAFREAGGKRFFFKLGGLVGTYGGSQPSPESGQGLLKFFEEIGTYWGPSENAPKYNPLHLFNNLWCFDLA
jgi:hypothetical protein